MTNDILSKTLLATFPGNRKTIKIDVYHFDFKIKNNYIKHILIPPSNTRKIVYIFFAHC
jgi:hypothetical protein